MVQERIGPSASGGVVRGVVVVEGGWPAGRGRCAVKALIEDVLGFMGAPGSCEACRFVGEEFSI
jgi:hypothetical protein